MTDWPKGTGRITLASVDSTNAEAMRRLAAGACGPFWVLAASQTAGKGRRGRAWLGEPGNFFATCGLELGDTAPGLAALRSFAAALALAETFETCGVPGDRIALKWPNDVLLDGAKVAGILLESTAPAGRLTLAVGIGVNLAEAPDPGNLEPQALRPTALSDHAPAISPAAFLDLLAPRFSRWEHELDAAGFAPLRAAWLARAARLGEQITARLPDRDITGIFETVDETGAIVLDTANGPVALAAAEIHLGEVAHASGD